MKRCIAALALLALASRVDAACVRVENAELIQYNCEGGSVEDLKQIPSNAEKIRISNMPVSHVTEALFSRFANSLIVLTCSHCYITEIDDDAFRRLENLQQLSLDNNHLREVKGAWFEGLVYLTYLDLNYNSIERIDGDVFRNAPDLVDLRLSGNRLLCLDIESMSKLKALKRIFLNENPNFGCPNAVKKFLNDRKIDFEADPYWSSVPRDRFHAGEPLPPVEDEEDVKEEEPELEPEPAPAPTTTMYTPRVHWTEPPMTTTTEYTTPSLPPTPPRRPYIPEMVQPSVPEQDFAYQGPYYAPKVDPPPQQLDNYRTNATEQARNATEATISAVKGMSDHQDTTTDATTTECPNAAPGSRDTFVLVPILAALLHRWTML